MSAECFNAKQTHVYTCTHTDGNVNERSVADKNGGLLIIKSYIKRVGLAINFHVNNSLTLGREKIRAANR